jgi:hypothetical protein
MEHNNSKVKTKMIQLNRRIQNLLKNKQRQEKEIKEMIKDKKSTIKQFRQYNQQIYKIRHEEMEEKIRELVKQKNKKT